ncbi:MAG TPA: right-handed parallel beta-helix repeat-containing protein, partial [Puia sp.]|nr:right-handed parallel beta-helix repeat-containing protein [Puia sp.]
GIKFMGNPNNLTGLPRPQAYYYYPITKENKNLKNLEVSQCYFIAEKNSAPIQGGIYVNGPNTHIDRCVFYNCRNAILLFSSAEGFSITHCIIYGAYESAIWMGPVDSAFRFEGNIVTKCNFFWVRPSKISPRYQFENSMISENNHYLGTYGNGENLVELNDYKNVMEKNIIKTGSVNLVEMKTETLPHDFLQVLPGSPGSSSGAGIFNKK